MMKFLKKIYKKAIQISNIVYPGNSEDPVDTLYGDGGFKKTFNKKQEEEKSKYLIKMIFHF